MNGLGTTAVRFENMQEEILGIAWIRTPGSKSMMYPYRSELVGF